MIRAKEAFYSTLIGVIYAPIWLWLWSKFIAATPHLSWLLDLGMPGNVIRVASNAMDLAVNILMALMPAFALVKINGNRTVGTLIALVAWIITLAAITRSGFVADLLKTPSMLLLITAIPIAVWLVRNFYRPQT